LSFGRWFSQKFLGRGENIFHHSDGPFFLRKVGHYGPLFIEKSRRAQGGLSSFNFGQYILNLAIQ
jgi:hypothetical protein